MGRKLLAVVFAVVGLAGLAVVPGYWAYARYVAGEELAGFDVYGGDEPLPGADEGAGLVTFPASHDRSWRIPVRIKLSPEMNPVLLRLKISSRLPPARHERSVRYAVAVRNAGHSLVEKTVVFSESRKDEQEGGRDAIRISVGGRTQTVAIFDVAEAGDYTLDVKDIGPITGFEVDRLRVDRVRCVFRRNSRRVNLWTCAAGLALFIVGAIGFAVFAGITRVKK